VTKRLLTAVVLLAVAGGASPPQEKVADVFHSHVPAKPANRIDEIVFSKLKSLGIEPILCSDAVFVRRAYLDVTGTLPSADEAKAFIQDSQTKDKRVAPIDRLLNQPAHADYWAMRWANLNSQI